MAEFAGYYTRFGDKITTSRSKWLATFAEQDREADVPDERTTDGDAADIDQRSAARGRPRDAWAVDGFAPLPGDTVSLPGGERGLVETVYLCAEPSGD